MSERIFASCERVKRCPLLEFGREHAATCPSKLQANFTPAKISLFVPGIFGDVLAPTRSLRSVHAKQGAPAIVVIRFAKGGVEREFVRERKRHGDSSIAVRSQTQADPASAARIDLIERYRNIVGGSPVGPGGGDGNIKIPSLCLTGAKILGHLLIELNAAILL